MYYQYIFNNTFYFLQLYYYLLLEFYINPYITFLTCNFIFNYIHEIILLIFFCLISHCMKRTLSNYHF